MSDNSLPSFLSLLPDSKSPTYNKITSVECSSELNANANALSLNALKVLNNSGPNVYSRSMMFSRQISPFQGDSIEFNFPTLIFPHMSSPIFLQNPKEVKFSSCPSQHPADNFFVTIFPDDSKRQITAFTSCQSCSANISSLQHVSSTSPKQSFQSRQLPDPSANLIWMTSIPNFAIFTSPRCLVAEPDKVLGWRTKPMGC